MRRISLSTSTMGKHLTRSVATKNESKRERQRVCIYYPTWAPASPLLQYRRRNRIGRGNEPRLTKRTLTTTALDYLFDELSIEYSKREIEEKKKDKRRRDYFASEGVSMDLLAYMEPEVRVAVDALLECSEMISEVCSMHPIQKRY